jgi:hypothetical protein
MHLTYLDSDGHKGAVSAAPVVEAGAPEDEIEVTPAMIAAGVACLSAYDANLFAPDLMVSEIFRVMDMKRENGTVRSWSAAKSEMHQTIA